MKTQTKFKKGDKFKTPLGIVTIMSIATETNIHGNGYRIGRVIVPFNEFEKNVENNTWIKLK